MIVNDQFESAVDQMLGLLRGGPGFESTRPELKPLIAELLA